MNIYLPIVEMSTNMYVILLVSMFVGMLSGIFGIGGGFLLTPLLSIFGLPSSYIVGTQSIQIISTSTSSTIAHTQNKTVDFKMGLFILSGGLSGSFIGILIFNFMKKLGQIDIFINIIYIILLGGIGNMMLYTNIKKLYAKYIMIKKSQQDENLTNQSIKTKKLNIYNTIVQKLPGKVHFKNSNLHISFLIPVTIGLLIGTVSAILGIGGGFIMIPAMLYIIKMPVKTVVGTSLFQTIFIAINTSLLQSTINHSVDIVLGLIMICGGILGAQIGNFIGSKIKGENIQILLAFIIIAVWIKLLFKVFATPSSVFELVLNKGF